MDDNRALRVYKGPSNPKSFMDAVNSLSFQCRNMIPGSPNGVVSLTQKLSFGTVTVTRIGSMNGQYHGVEFVTTELFDDVFQIILSSAKNETFGIGFRLSKRKCKVKKRMSRISLPAIYFYDTFIDPDFDSFYEVCPFIYTIKHHRFIITAKQRPVMQGVNGVFTSRNDWHNNSYTNYPDLASGQHGLSYYESCGRNISSVHVGFSFSPYTYISGLAHIDRYISHLNRLYIPILGRSDKFIAKYPKLSGCIGYPFGKKPFTLVKNNFKWWKEVVRPRTTIPSPDINQFNMTILWPFTPYIREIASFNLQFINGFPRKYSLANFDPFYSYWLHYEENGEEELRTDEISGDFPAESASNSFNTTIKPAEGTVSGNSDWTDTASKLHTYNIKKSLSIGTVGNKKDLYVETTLTGELEYNKNMTGWLTRTSNFPGIYYLPEFVDTLFWQCCNMADETSAEENLLIEWKNTITGSQRLMVGDVEIDSGDISMEYVGTETRKTTHDGTANRAVTGAPTHLGYTTLQMLVGESQTIDQLDEDDNIVSGGEIELTGVGSIAGSIYTAPASMVGCENQPHLKLKVCGVEVDEIIITVNAVTTNDIAYQSQQLYSSSGGGGTASCDVDCIAGVVPCAPCWIINCSFTLYSYNCQMELQSSTLVTHQQSCPPDSPANESCTAPGDCLDGAGIVDCDNVWHSFADYWGTNDKDCRSAAQIEAGCCPYPLM